ncbi:MAG TPA: hypothetical protein VIK95_01265 [Egibacteraceae bacterium]
MRVQQYGLEADLPTGWEARIYRRDRASAARARADAASEPPSAPILHAANFPLPEDRGDFGSGAVDRMRSPHVFFALVEYEPEAAGTPLFAASGPPWPLDPGAFGPAQLQRYIPGQSGAQFFFSHEGRAFCLFAVLGNHVERRRLVTRTLNPALERLRIGPRSER